MRVVTSLDNYVAEADLLLSIGVFDGVHVGHRSVLERLTHARRPGAIAGALTFQQHPQAFLQPGHAPAAITTADEKINLLAGCGLDVLFLLPFDGRIQQLEPQAFLEDMLVKRLRTRLLIVGDQWRFGKGRSGDVGLAQRVLNSHGCAFEAEPLIGRDGEKISSSRIRELILRCEFAAADDLLGSPYEVRGIVRTGDGRGHVLGYPTANLAIASEKLIPPEGVYACQAHHAGKTYTAVTSIGDKPTFGGESGLTVETYILDFSASIYGEQLTLSRWRYLRAQRRFDSVPALVAQMAADVAAAVAGT